MSERRTGRPLEAADLVRFRAPLGLCERCRHARVLSARASVFLRCARAEEDPTLLRYPPLPVLRCHGFTAGPG